MRGKAKTKIEFGAKINFSLLDGYARVDHFHRDAFNEGQDLQAQVERFRKLTGKRQNATRLKGSLVRASVDMV
ncbi:MAG: hypothetical protein EOM11_09255 [Erysipelotrichia bacterium]|nr:hypothetical protein [Erysipelotrichia bacterium]